MTHLRYEALPLLPLLSQVTSGRFALESEREPSAWDTAADAALIDSVCKGWPIGLLAVSREGAGATILDGRARLSTLAAAFSGASEWTLRWDGEIVAGEGDADRFPLAALVETMRYLPHAEHVRARNHEGEAFMRRVDAVSVVLQRMAVPVVTVEGATPAESAEILVRLSR